MGRSSVSGPLYGAKTLLFARTISTVATAQTDLEIFEIDVPATEDWLITNTETYCTTAGSAAATLDIEDDTTSILPSAITLSAANNSPKTITADSGEDEGKLVAAGSAITVDCTTGTTSGPTEITVNVWGFIRSLQTT